MDDRLLVSRAAAGDIESFGQLYDAYFARIYDFTWRVLLDAGQAAELTAAVFSEALRDLGALPRDHTFRTWLFGLAYRSAVGRDPASVADSAGATDAEAFGAFGVPDPARIADSSVDASPDSALCGWDAAAALGPQDRAFLDLHLRQGMSSSELAPILGVSAREAALIVTRMTAAARDAMTAYIVAHTSDCDGLRGVVGAAGGMQPYTREARTAVADHIARCPACQAVRRTTPDPLEMYSLFSPVEAPLALKGDIWSDLSSHWSSAGVADAAFAWRSPAGGLSSPAMATAAAAGIGGSFGGGSGGGPIVFGGDDGSDRRRMIWFVAAAAGLVLFAFAFGAVLVKAFGGGGGSDSSGGVVPPTRTPSAEQSQTPAGVSTAPAVAVQTPTPDLTPSVTATPSETPAPPPPPPPPATSTPAPPPATPTANIRTVAPFRTPTQPPLIPATPTPRR